MNETTQQNAPVLGYLSLFSSAGTLLCCALPSLLVLFGLGATVASFFSAMPWVVTLSHHKDWVFVISGLLIAGNRAYVYAIGPKLRARGNACSLEAPETCDTASRVSRIVLWLSVTLYFVGLFSAYALGPILIQLDS